MEKVLFLIKLWDYGTVKGMKLWDLHQETSDNKIPEELRKGYEFDTFDFFKFLFVRKLLSLSFRKDFVKF